MDLPGLIGDEADGYERMARKGLSAYGLSDARLRLVSRKKRVVFSVIDDGPGGREVYALRISGRDESKNQLMREFLLLGEIRRGSTVEIPEPVLARTGELFRSVSTPGVSGFRLLSLLRWVRGRRIPIEDWTKEGARAVGRTIGEIHRSCEGFDWPADLRPAGEGEDRIPSLDGLLSPSYREGFERARELARRSLRALADDPTAKGVIHADLRAEHILFSRSGVGVIGFSSCRMGFYLYDLASIALELDEGLRAQLISGYREIRPVRVENFDGFLALRALDILQKGGEEGSRAITLLRRFSNRD